MTPDITKMSVIELKALAYDQLAQIEQCQGNLRMINLEISNQVNKTLGSNIS